MSKKNQKNKKLTLYTLFNDIKLTANIMNLTIIFKLQKTDLKTNKLYH